MRSDGNILALYLAHRSNLVKYASTIVGDRGRAEDVVQEAWLRLGSAGRLDEPVAFLYRVVRNLSIDGRRRLAWEGQTFFGNHPGIDDRAADQPSPEAEASGREELGRLARALAELPERTRIALEMRRFGGFKLKDIAARLGVSISVAHDIVAEGIAYCRDRVRPPER